MAAYTTSDLLTDIKLRVFVPTSQSTFEDSDLLRLADQQMQLTVLPLLMSLRAEYFVTYKDVAVVAGQAGYDIPARAVGMQLRDVHLLDGAGNLQDLGQIDPESITSTAEGTPAKFFLRMNKVHLYPTPSSASGTLRLYYFLRPGRLVETTSAALVSAIDTVTGDVTVSSLPSAWTTSDAFDLIRREGASEPLTVDLAASAIAGTVLTFPAASLPATLAQNDYVALAGESPIPQIPAELRPVLAQAVAVRVCESMNLPGLDSARKTLEEELKAVQLLLTPRVIGAAKKIVSRTGWL